MTHPSLQLADAFLKADELDDALAALDTYLEEAPADDQALRLRANIHARMPHTESFESALHDIVHLSHRLPEDFILHSTLLERLGRTDEAAHILNEGAGQYPDSERLTERCVQFFAETNQIAVACEHLERLGTNWRSWQWAGDLAVQVGDDEAAHTHYSASLDDLGPDLPPELHPTAARLRLVRAGCALRLARFAAAARDYALAADLIPTDPTIRFNQGIATFLDGQRDQGIRLCENALAASPQALKDDFYRFLSADPEFASVLKALSHD